MTGEGFPGGSPRVRRWLGDVEPAWTALAFQSFIALRNEPSATNRALSIANDLTRDELDSSAVARNALVLIRRAGVGDGLKLTATGNLTRSVVAEMIDLFDWPDFDKAEAFEFHKVVNEPDFLPLHFVRHVVEVARLVRKTRGTLEPSGRGASLRRSPNSELCLPSFST